eukprot:11076543-Alexandrium_andersonii.AAC.1
MSRTGRPGRPPRRRAGRARAGGPIAQRTLAWPGTLTKRARTAAIGRTSAGTCGRRRGRQRRQRGRSSSRPAAARTRARVAPTGSARRGARSGSAACAAAATTGTSRAPRTACE